MCRRSLRVLKALDLLGKIEPLDIVAQLPAIQERFPTLQPQDLLRDMHVVRADGRVDRGFNGFRSLAWVLPAGWLVLPLAYLPGVPFIGRRIYRRIADNRCTSASCPARS